MASSRRSRTSRPEGRCLPWSCEVSRPAVSQHLRFLRDAGLIAERRQGTRRFYRAQPENLAALKAFIEVFVGDETNVEPR